MKFNKILFLFTIFCIFILQSSYSQVQNTMVRIQGGTFLMGSPTGEPGRHMADESPQHQVTVSSFYISRFPITQAEYLEIMGVNPSHHRDMLNHPVEMVSWLMAIEYCNRRSIAEGLTPVYTIDGNNVTWNREANGYRLPTEAEWEYACRAGTTTPFNIGTNMDEAGWHRENSFTILESGSRVRRTYPVGEKLPNAWGLYDMHGNVLEWCWDWFGPYTPEPKVNPIGPSSSPRGARVYRGGSFDFMPAQCRSAYRFGNRPTFRLFYTGFRVARNAEY
jgi:formylglycine-generating enzyme required for sulfatase activity